MNYTICYNFPRIFTQNFIKGGYKGYGLSMMVETFCGIMSGGAFGPFVRQWKDFKKPANLVSTKTT